MVKGVEREAVLAVIFGVIVAFAAWTILWHFNLTLDQITCVNCY